MAAQQCDEARAELAAQRDKAFSIKLEKPARVAAFHLTPGLYQAVVLSSGTNAGDLYLFSGAQVEESQLKAIARVETAPPTTGVTSPEVRLDAKSPAGLTEVRTTEKTFKIR